MQALRFDRGIIFAIMLITWCKYSTNASIEKQNFSKEDLPWLKRMLKRFEYPHHVTIVSYHESLIETKTELLFLAHSRKESIVVEKNQNERKHNSAKRNRFHKTA